MSGINDPLLITENGYSEKIFENFKIRVFYNDGPVPRFHLINNENPDIETCINLFDSSYSGSILSQETCDKLYEYLSADQDIFDNTKINWQGLCMLWDAIGNDMENFDFECLKSNNMLPDYQNLMHKGE